MESIRYSLFANARNERETRKSGVVPASPSSPSQERKSEAKRRQTQWGLCRAAGPGRAPIGVRTSVGVPPRFSPQGVFHRKELSLRPGFLGRGLSVERVLPAPACPLSPARTAHPGHSAEGLMPKAARERVASPPAGTATSPRDPALPAGPRPLLGEAGLYVSETVTIVNRSVTIIFNRHPEVRAERASKGDGPGASANSLRGPLSRPPQDDGARAVASQL
jgi:hypothetical protein